MEVLARGSLPPVANPDHVSAVAGQDAVVSPLENDFDPAGSTLRLARMEGPPAARVSPHYDVRDLRLQRRFGRRHLLRHLSGDQRAGEPTWAGQDRRHQRRRPGPRWPSGTWPGFRRAARPWWMHWQTTSTPPGACSSSNPSAFPQDRRCRVAVLDHSVLKITRCAGPGGARTSSRTQCPTGCRAPSAK